MKQKPHYSVSLIRVYVVQILKILRGNAQSQRTTENSLENGMGQIYLTLASHPTRQGHIISFHGEITEENWMFFLSYSSVDAWNQLVICVIDLCDPSPLKEFFIFHVGLNSYGM